MIKQFIRFYTTGFCFEPEINYLVEVEGKHALSNGVIQRTKDAIKKYKEENKECDIEYDELVYAACKHLQTEGYTCNHVSNLDIEL